MTRTIKLRRGLFAGTAALALVLAACGSDNSSKSSSVASLMATSRPWGPSRTSSAGSSTSAAASAWDRPSRRRVLDVQPKRGSTASPM